MGVRERYNEKKKKQGESPVSSVGVRERYELNKKYSGVQTDNVNGDYINSFFTDANNFLGKTNAEENGYNTWKDLSSKAETVRAWAWQNRNALDEETYKSLNDSLSTFESAGSFWNSFSSPEEYDLYRKLSPNQEKYSADTKSAYETAEGALTDKNTFTSDLSAEQREQRIKEIQSELAEARKVASGLSRGAMYGDVSDMVAKNNEKISALEAELKELERVGTFSAADMLQWDIEDAKVELASAQAKVNSFGARPSESQISEYSAAQSELYAAQQKLDSLKKQQGLYTDISKFGDDANKDTFFGQFAANYRSSELSREADKAINAYLDNPTEENRQIAYAYAELAKQYAENNEKALDDEGQVLPWLSQSAAGYLPQLRDQIIPEAVGGVVGGLLGSTVGLTKEGASLGAGLGSSLTNYGVMRGSVYRALIAEGVNEEIARKAANDEAILGALIEGGESAATIWGILVAGGKGGAAGKAVTKAASKASAPLLKKVLAVLGGVAGNAASEYGEEWLQQAVSIANKERAMQGNTGNLVFDTGKVAWDAITGKNPDARAEMHEAGTEGFKIGLMFGGGTTVANGVITHYANAKTEQMKNDIADAVIDDKEALAALIDEGKASGGVSAKLAEEVEAASENGKVTRSQVKRLIESNEVYIKNEEQTEPDTLEKAAMDVVNDRNGKETKPFTFTEAQKVTGWGNHGSELVTSLANSEGITLDQAKKAVETAYLAGFTGMDKAQASFVTETQEKAFDAGKRDWVMQDTAAKEKAKTATVYGKDSGVIKNEYYEKLSPAEQEMFSVFAEDFGESAEMVNEIVAAVIKGKKYMASAEHSDGRIRGSAATKKPVHQWILHENGHRMEQFATDEWNTLASALYARAEQLGRRAKTGVSEGMAFDRIKDQHDKAGQTLSTRGYVGEVVMRELETIFSSAEEFNRWRAELDAKPQVKTAWAKFMDWLTEILEKIKQIVANRKLSPEARKAAKAEIAEIEHIKELYANAYKATRTAVAERTAVVEQAKSEQTGETAEPDTLEKAARDVVDQRNAAQASEVKPQATMEGKGEQIHHRNETTSKTKNKGTTSDAQKVKKSPSEKVLQNVQEVSGNKEYNVGEQMSTENGDYVSPQYETSESRKPIVATDMQADKKRRSEAAEKYGLSSDEAKRLSNYVGGQFCYVLNNRMINGTLVEGDSNIINDIRNALLKLPEYSGRTYRNLRFKTENQYNDFLEEYTEGNTVEFKAFTSSSKSPNGYPLFGGKVVHLVIDGVSGRDISDTFGLPRQQEVVYLPSTKIEIKKVMVANDGNPLIFAQEVESNENIRPKETGNTVNNRSTTGKHQDLDGQGTDSDGNGANYYGVSGKVRSGNGGDVLLSQRGEGADGGNVLVKTEVAEGEIKTLKHSNAPFNSTETKILCSKPRLMTFDMNGSSYITDGFVVIQADNAAIEYIKGEYKSKSNNEVTSVDGARIEAIVKNDSLGEVSQTVTDNITETDKNGKARVKHRRTACIVDKMAFLYDTRYFDMLSKRSDTLKILSGGNLQSTVLAGYDANGDLVGFIMPIKPATDGYVEVDGKQIPYTLNIKKESSTTKKKATAKETPKKAKPKVVETTAKIDDFGEKIGGARKDQWNSRGLIVDDLDGMNDREREKNVKKDNVWKRPNYRALVEAGGDRGLLWAVNEIRKSLQQNIFYGYSHNLTAEIKAKKQKLFIETIRAIQEMAENAKTQADFEAMGEKWLLDNGYLEETGNIYKKYVYTNKFSNNPALYGTNYLNNIRYLAKNFDSLTNLADRNQFAVDAKSVIPKGFSIVGGEGSVGGKYVRGEWGSDGKWIEDTSYAVAKGRYIIKGGFATKEAALEWLKQGVAKKKGKTRFVPEQLLEVHRKGPDYRNSKNVDGQNYIDTFGFKGGEFGNWMSAKDRQVSLDYGFDALKDLADALSVADTDISLGGNLNIAFGARGQGLSGAAAHYENERRVINLTKMNGAGSLAHEWFHALDDFIGGYTNNFATDRYHSLPERTKQAIRDLISTMQYKDATQEETDLSKQKMYEQAVRGITNTIEGEFHWVKAVENGTFKEADAKYYKRVPTLEDAKKYRELFDKLIETGEYKYVERLSELRKEVDGHVIPKEVRDSFAWRLISLNSAKSAPIQRARKMTDFYNDSRTFGKLHAKDGDYWDSTVEMSARAFACYVADKTNKQNDYLSAHSDSAVTLDADRDGNPVIVRAFPVGEERTAINNAFDNLIDALKADGFLHDRGQTEKPADVSYSLEDSERDRTYIDAVESGDMETAQKMVYEAAKAAGYTEEVFHGMGNRYNTYKSGNGQYGAGVYFTADKGIASDYGKVVDHLFVKIGNIADYEDVYKALGKTDSQTLDEFAQSLGFPNFDDMISDWDNDPTEVASNPDLIDMLKNRGFEGFVDDGNAGFVLWDFDGIAYRIKSAEPVTYDDNGNIIPLSERFDSKNKDIRYSLEEYDFEYLELAENPEQNEAKLRTMVEEAAKTAGYTQKLYHGTNQFGFTVIDGTEGYSYDQIQFFTTDSLETANTYAGTGKTRGVAEKYELDYDVEDEYEEQAREVADDLASYMSSEVGYYGYIEADYIIDKVKNGSDENLYDVEDEWMFAIYDGQYSDEYEEFDEFQESSEGEKLSDKFHSYLGQINSIYKALDKYETSGIYEFFANTDNLFVIDGEGKNWNALEDSRLPDRKMASGFRTDDGKTHGSYVDALNHLVDQANKQGGDVVDVRNTKTEDKGGTIKVFCNGRELGTITKNEIKLKYKTRDVCEWARREGYAGVLFKNVADSGSGEKVSPADVYAFFSPQEQVKSADPVTYDDNGNVIPLSERFNSENNDIRYSLEDMEESDVQNAQKVISSVEKKLFTITPKSGYQYSLDDFDEAPSKKTKEFLNAIDDLRNGKKNASDKLVKYVDSGMISTDDYEGLIKKYGAISEGEKPHREIRVPQKTEKDKKVSQTVRTILEAKATPDEAIPTIEKMVEDGVFSYDVYTDKKAMSDADAYIKEYGWDESLRDWLDSVNKGEVSKQITAMGWALYNNAANTAATTASQSERDVAVRTSLEILNAMVQHQRSAAQALQATRILKKLAPETQLYGMQKSVSALANDLTEKYGKKAPNLKIDEKLAEDFLNAKTQEERDAAAEEIYKDIGRQMPSDWLDKWNAWRYLAMLGNPRTHIKNIGGNAFFAPVVLAKNFTATAIESIVYRVSGKKTLRGKALIVGNKADRALLKAAWSDYANVADQVTDGGKYNDSALANQSIEQGRTIFKFKPLEKARKLNSAALEAEDMWFSQPHYAYALAQYCKANNITPEQIARGKAIAPAREYAIKEAQKATYRDTNAFSQMVSEWGRNSRGKKSLPKKVMSTVIEGVLPFRKTPANILVRGVEYSPIGLIKGLTYDLYQVSKGKMTSSEVIDNISAGLTGTGLMAIGVLLAAQGLVRGHGEGDKEEKEFKETMGHQAYSLELPNGESITLDWLAPEALPFFVGVNLWEATRGSNEDVNFSTILDAVSKVSEPMLEMSCLQGLNDLFESVGYASSNDTSGMASILASAVTSYLTQALPTISGQVERTGEEYRMTTYTEKDAFLTGDMQYTIGKASAKIPLVDYHQIPYIDAWGRKEASGTALKRGFNNFLNPAYTSTIEESDMEKELLRLFEQTGENSVFPERANKYFTVDGERKDLTADEYVKYATLKGQNSYDAITKLVQSKEYQNLDDGEKVKAIEDAYTYADQKAKSAISNYKPDKWVSAADNMGTNVEDYFTFRASVSAAGDDGSTSKSEVVDVISEMDIDNDDAWTLYLSKYDSKSAIEAEQFGINAKLYMSAVVDMASITPDYDRNGKAISGSRRAKVERYLDSVCGSYREYLFLLGTEFESVKKDHDYIAYFGN